MKRFYKLVSTKEENGGYAITLDGKPVKTPGGALLCAGNQNLANAVAGEWSAQEEEIKPESMKLTQILSTRIDRIGTERTAITESLLKYLDTDLLCYRAEEPPGVAKRQAAAWDPHLSWFEKRFGCALETTSGLRALKQPAAVHEKTAEYIASLDDDRFTVFQLVTALSGSLVLAIAFTEKTIGAEEVFTASHIEESHKAEIYNEEFYGRDPHQEKTQKARRADLEAAASYLNFF